MPPLESSAYGKLVTEFFCTTKGGTNTTENLICIWGVVETCNQRQYMNTTKLNLLVVLCLCASLITSKLVACFQPWAVLPWHCQHAPRKKKTNNETYNHMVCHYVKHCCVLLVKTKNNGGHAGTTQKYFGFAFMQQGKGKHDGGK
jgi:hypothetical protein